MWSGLQPVLNLCLAYSIHLQGSVAKTEYCVSYYSYYVGDLQEKEHLQEDTMAASSVHATLQLCQVSSLMGFPQIIILGFILGSVLGALPEIASHSNF